MNYFNKALTVADKTLANYKENKTIEYWEGSPLNSIRSLPPRTKGKYGEDLVAEILSSHYIDIMKSNNSKYDFKISYDDSKTSNVEIKTSFLWATTQEYQYKFQQIRLINDYDLVLCLGISKDDIKLYPFTKKDLTVNNKRYSIDFINDNGFLKVQHSNDSRWFSINELGIEPWHSSGDIEEAIEFIYDYLMED